VWRLDQDRKLRQSQGTSPIRDRVQANDNVTKPPPPFYGTAATRFACATTRRLLRIDSEVGDLSHRVLRRGREMEDRGKFYVGILLLAVGCLFLAAQVTGGWRAPFGILRFGWAGMWPFLILLIGGAFWLAIFVWWDRHEQIAGLAVPGTIIVTNGLILLLQNVTGRWGSWSYLWTLEPIAVAAGLLALYVLGNRQRGLLVAAAILGGIGVTFFLIFATAFSGLFRLLGPVVLILIGVLVILSGLGREIPASNSNGDQVG